MDAMRIRILVACALAACMVVATAAPASAGTFFEGRNIYAWPKAHTIWTGQLMGPSDEPGFGVVQALETACHDGVGLSIVAPRVLPLADSGVLSIVTEGGDTYLIPVRDYQLQIGFLFVLDHWPLDSPTTGEPWPVRPEWFWMNPDAAPSGDVMPLYVEWDRPPLNYDLTVGEFLAALSGEGSVTLSLYGDGTLLAEGLIR